jgi:phthalate 4,5-dioxygenase oxygenase subunit
VPLDDLHHMLYSLHGWLDRAATAEERQLAEADPFASVGGYVERTSDPLTRYQTMANCSNDFLFDEQLARNHLVFGVPFVYNLHDRAITESMGPIYDRTREHLCSTDAMVIFLRRALLKAAKTLQEQAVGPPGMTDPTLCRVRAASLLLPRGANWIGATEAARDADAGAPLAAVAHF